MCNSNGRYFLMRFVPFQIRLASLIILSISCCQAEKDLEVIQPDPELSVIEPESDNGSQQITNNFLVSAVNTNPDDTLESFLDFLKENEDKSPVTSLLELRSLLLQQKEEKVALQSLVDQMKTEMRGIK